MLTLQKGSCFTESRLWDLCLWLHQSRETPFAWPGVSLDPDPGYRLQWAAFRVCQWSQGPYQFELQGRTHSFHQLEPPSCNASPLSWAQCCSATGWRSLEGQLRLWVHDDYLSICMHACSPCTHTSMCILPPFRTCLHDWQNELQADKNWNTEESKLQHVQLSFSKSFFISALLSAW